MGGIKWVGLILMIIAALVYWVSKVNNLEPIFTNVSIVSIVLGVIIMATGVIIGKRIK
ncbi:hypothetical protein [Halalkalibacter lacteus]|uniref:hypothetical protein n=1 Tax=Halalkalibacter lacteus TaxID=3090663 RepID=UPI002FC7B8B5